MMGAKNVNLMRKLVNKTLPGTMSRKPPADWKQ
jgi:hypothetical protein